jgi:hypothetical protein
VAALALALGLVQASDLIYRALGDDEDATVDEGGNLYEVAIG